jgi:hypothetical protein
MHIEPCCEPDPYVVHEKGRGKREVKGVRVHIKQLVWSDGRSSFEVYRVDTKEDLTINECFDDMPTDEQIEALLP